MLIIFRSPLLPDPNTFVTKSEKEMFCEIHCVDLFLYYLPCRFKILTVSSTMVPFKGLSIYGEQKAFVDCLRAMELTVQGLSQTLL